MFDLSMCLILCNQHMSSYNLPIQPIFKGKNLLQRRHLKRGYYKIERVVENKIFERYVHKLWSQESVNRKPCVSIIAARKQSPPRRFNKKLRFWFMCFWFPLSKR